MDLHDGVSELSSRVVNGRKRHIAVDTGGLLLVVLVTVAGIQDRDAWLCQPEVDLDLAYIS